MAKKGQIFKKYSPEFKISVIMDMREHHMGYLEVVRKYWDIPKGKEKNYHGIVQKWERIFLEEGAEGLMKERRGRSGNRLPKLNEKEERDLIAENQRLRMENEYLKKLNALVQERIRRESGKR